MPEQKGGHVWAGYTRVYITSNVDPATWYSRSVIPDQSPLFRRINDIYYVEDRLYTDISYEDVRSKPYKTFPVQDVDGPILLDSVVVDDYPAVVPSGSVADAAANGDVNLLSDMSHLDTVATAAAVTARQNVDEDSGIDFLWNYANFRRL